MTDRSHVVTRINEHYYTCGECGQAGSERWAILHQFPMDQLVSEDTDAPNVRHLAEMCIRSTIDQLMIAKGYGCMDHADELARNIMDQLIIQGIWGVATDTAGR